jgi:hypothetical protein
MRDGLYGKLTNEVLGLAEFTLSSGCFGLATWAEAPPLPGHVGGRACPGRLGGTGLTLSSERVSLSSPAFCDGLGPAEDPWYGSVHVASSLEPPHPIL